MKIHVGTITLGGHVRTEELRVAPAGLWCVWVPQTATDPVVQVRYGETKNWDNMGNPQTVPVPKADELTAFMPPFRAQVTVKAGRVNLEVMEAGS